MAHHSPKQDSDQLGKVAGPIIAIIFIIIFLLIAANTELPSLEAADPTPSEAVNVALVAPTSTMPLSNAATLTLTSSVTYTEASPPTAAPSFEPTATLSPTDDPSAQSNNTVVIGMPTRVATPVTTVATLTTNSTEKSNDTIVIVMPTSGSTQPTDETATQSSDTVVIVMPTSAAVHPITATDAGDTSNSTPTDQQNIVMPTTVGAAGGDQAEVEIDPELIALGEEIFLRTAGGVGCQYCHGLDARGDVGPNIVGKSAARINQAIGEVQMMAVVGNLTQRDIEAVAAYLATLPGALDAQPTANAVIIVIPTRPISETATPRSESSTGGVAIAPEVDGDPENGRLLFQSNACFACHNTDSDETLIGPGLLTVGERAGTRIDGLDAIEYIRQSIREPGAFVVQEFNPVMLPFVNLTDQEVNDLIAYLLTLNTESESGADLGDT